MQTREYGSTGERLSIIGFGGIIVSGVEASEASRYVGEAYDRGVNYYDVAPTYGNAQEMLGAALAPYRKNAFLACKTTQRTAEGSRKELEESLRLLRTDRVDLYQMHSLNTEEDLATAMGPGGALETFTQAREEGKTRYLGFSSHSAEVALKLMDQFDFDSVLFPVCWVNYFRSGFGPQVIEKAESKGMGRLALKALAQGKVPEGERKKWTKCWYQPIEEPVLADLALRFALSQPITAAVTPGEGHFLSMALDIADRFTPITEAEMAELERQAATRTPLFEMAAQV